MPLTHVHVDGLLRVRPGEKVPVDGVVVLAMSLSSASFFSNALRLRGAAIAQD